MTERCAPAIELLAPAGHWDCARAAVENGADAIYFGLDVGFNARARANNFHVDQLNELMDMLHRQAVRGYVTLNTLIFTNELDRLESNVHLLAENGVDAVLVQDLGVARLLQQLCPELEVHASTQMTLTNAEAIEEARELGVKRVVLARELAIKEIKKIAHETDMPLEVFVHGALCVAYSGQCLTSESLGGRSANRGQCAQACRLPYDLVCDGKHVDLDSQRYLLSPQDLAAHDLIPELIDAGVCSLKIEGRLKTPEYVANVCRHYRQAIDAAQENRRQILTASDQRELELSFSRGFSPGWLEGCDHKRLVPGLSSAKRGVFLGNAIRISGDKVQLELAGPVAQGDGIVFEGNRFEGAEIGSRVFQIEINRNQVARGDEGQTVWLGLKHGSLKKSEIPIGTRVYKTDDPQLTKRLRRSFGGTKPNKKAPLDIELQIATGKPIRLKARLSDVTVQHVEFETEYIPEPATQHPITEATARTQLSRLGNTTYEIRSLHCDISDSPMVPLSVLGGIRKELINRLDSIPRIQKLTITGKQVAQQMLKRLNEPKAPTADTQATELRVLCRSLVQLEQALANGAKSAILEFHDIREYRTGVAKCRAASCHAELATLRIHKPGENGLFRALEKHGADSWLVRNLAALRYCRKAGIPFSVDFSMNVTNPLTADWLVQKGARLICPSYDLNRDQLLELVAAQPCLPYEVVIHQHMPMFHMEHCVFCSVLSPGKNKTDCGRPCDHHDVKLADRVGKQHVLHADIGCRNTLYNATAQSGAEAVPELIKLGVLRFRIELLRDAITSDTAQLIGLYQKLLDGKMKGTDVWQKLQAENRVGVTRGTLEQKRNPLAII